MATVNIIVSGPSRSGKTRVFNAISRLLSGMLKQLPNGVSFIVSETNKDLTPIVSSAVKSADVFDQQHIEPLHIDWNQMGELGLVERINRQVLHPLGLAISRFPDSGVSNWVLVADDGKYEYSESLPSSDKLSDEQIRSLAFRMARGEK